MAEPYSGEAIVVERAAADGGPRRFRYVPCTMDGAEADLQFLDDTPPSDLIAGTRITVDEGFLDSYEPQGLPQFHSVKAKKALVEIDGQEFERPSSWPSARHNDSLARALAVVVARVGGAGVPRVLLKLAGESLGTGGEFVEPPVWAALLVEHDDAQAAAKAAQDKLAGEFVNPYNFVGLPPSAIKRLPPAGHLGLGSGKDADDGLIGKVTVRWTARSPILAPSPAHGGAQSGSGTGASYRQFVKNGNKVLIPGSAIKGLVRSTHETLCAGCMRVLDLDYVPVHREEVSNKRKSWSMVRVTRVNSEGEPSEVEVADAVVWVESGLLNPGGVAKPRTGDRFSIHPGELSNAEGQPIRRPKVDGKPVEDSASADNVDEYKKLVELRRDGDWTLLVSDTHARKKVNPTCFALGRFGEKSAIVRVEVAAGRSLGRRLEGTNDVREVKAGRRPNTLVDDNHSRLFERQAVIVPVVTGTLLWADLSKPQGDGRRTVTDLSVSQVWRREGKFKVGDRLAASEVSPCTSVDKLCPSCRIFGAVDDRGERQNEANGYRSHVRFGAAVVVGGGEGGAGPTPARAEYRMAPLGAPRPSAGQNYLEPRGTRGQAENHKGDTANEPALSTWGSEADVKAPRPIRGRKQYWHGSVDSQHQYWSGQKRKLRRRDEAPVARNDGNARREGVLHPEPEILPVGTVFEASVWFENLTSAELGSLLASIDPNLITSDLTDSAGLAKMAHPSGIRVEPELLVHLGGGKPLGFGSVRPEIVELRVDNGASRYGGGATLDSDAGPLADAFVSGADQIQRAAWPAFVALHHSSWVDPALIWYPPATPWTDVDPQGTRMTKFDESYRFFAKSSGRAAGESTFAPLPDPLDPAQPIDPVNPSKKVRNPTGGKKHGGGKS